MPISTFKLGIADIQQKDVQELILFHQRAAVAANAVCEGHALSVEAYMRPDLRLYEARSQQQLLAICGLMQLSPQMGELKTMHTCTAARGRGVGCDLLSYVLEQAQSLGLKDVYLETGTSPFFDAAVRLYTRLGFKDCPPFAAYVANPDSRFMMLRL